MRTTAPASENRSPATALAPRPVRDEVLDAQAAAAARALERWSSDERAQADWEAERTASDAELTTRLAQERERRARLRRYRLDGDPSSSVLTAIEQAVAGAPVWSDADPDGDLGDGLLSAFAATERITGCALWLQVLLAARLLVRRATLPPLLPGRAVARDRVPAGMSAEELLVMDEVATELALVARIARGKAHRLVVAARALVIDDRLPRTAEALRRGLLDAARLTVLVGRTEPLGAAAARAVEDVVLDTRGILRMPLRRFTDVVDRALLEVDARAAEERRRAARRGRRVGLQSLPDGQAALTAVGPCEALAAAFDGVDAGARRLRRAGDPRTLDQLRHDLLVAACLGPAGGAAVPGPGVEESPMAPGASPARDGEGGRRGRPEKDSFGRNGSRADAAAPPEHRAPDLEGPDLHRPDLHRPGSEEPASDRATSDDSAPWLTTTWPDVRATITVTVSAETLMGLLDAPGHLQGYGPIPAEVVRDLARDGVFRCAVVDGRHGTVLGVGRSTFTSGYVPGAGLRSLLDVLAPECDIPGCTVAVHRADLDHRHPHRRGGATCECNVRPLCRTHHRLKTAGVIRCLPSTDPDDPPGARIWMTRSGRRYAAIDPWLLPPDWEGAPGADLPPNSLPRMAPTDLSAEDGAPDAGRRRGGAAGRDEESAGPIDLKASAGPAATLHPPAPLEAFDPAERAAQSEPTGAGVTLTEPVDVVVTGDHDDPPF